MTRQFDLTGKSGSVYRYSPFEEDRFLPPSGANFVIAEDTADGLKVVYAGETDNLSSRAWSAPLEKARESNQKVFLLTRLNVTRAIRANEQQDLIDHYAPPMNGRSRTTTTDESPEPSPGEG